MFEEQIARGAARLDRHGPADWRERIDHDALDAQDVTRCVVGQTLGVTGSGPYGGDLPWALALFRLGSPPAGPLGLLSPAQVTWQNEHGFNTPADADVRDYARLTAEWRRYIVATSVKNGDVDVQSSINDQPEE